MKNLFIIIIFLFAPPVEDARQETNFDWITGDWTRTNGKTELTTTESWEKLSDSIYKGHGISKKNGETIFREDLRLVKKDDNWIYEVVGVNVDTTNFIITSFSSKSFSAENLKNPFPKQIDYKYENGKLVAEISDDSKKIVFEFRRD